MIVCDRNVRRLQMKEWSIQNTIGLPCVSVMPNADNRHSLTEQEYGQRTDLCEGL